MTAPPSPHPMRMTAITLDAPLGRAIAEGKRTAVVLDWRPASLPTGDLLIVEAPRGTVEREHDADGLALAVVRLAHIEDWSPPEQGACATWPPGWVAWQFSDIRPLPQAVQVPARSGLYQVELPRQV